MIPAYAIVHEKGYKLEYKRSKARAYKKWAKKRYKDVKIMKLSPEKEIR